MTLTNDIDARIAALVELKDRERRRTRHYTVREAIEALFDEFREVSALTITYRFPLVTLYEVRDELEAMLSMGVLELVPPVDHPVKFYRKMKPKGRK
ncbi:hypothetical protein ABR157_004553 [Enterobacter soli]